MSHKLVAIVVAVAVLVLGAGVVVAQSAEGTKFAPFIAQNAVQYVKAGGAMHLRASPPTETAFWYSKGEKIGLVRPGEELHVIDTKLVKYPFGEEYWLKVKRLDDVVGKKIGPPEGWIYYGGPEYVSPLTPPKGKGE